ncbi:putative membrane protein YhiD involved in acid resistance [Flavobacterium sp. 28A]|uniref:anti-sigma factor n=1 Tax=Flavobacterium sp. 28A TaxID=2735895 RepID=UPI00156FEBB8|nr:anti-sigma factor [Flavobacterium sp. 28A]NRT15787.1 putative membrane protein YhiD involved in acid resistance [Flavobacterium sp. 28A]
MRNENEKLDQMFDEHRYQWDTEHLELNHEQRFLKKLKKQNPIQKYFFQITVAATILILLGICTFYKAEEKSNTFEFASKETKQTDSIFTVLIANQLNKIQEKKSPENEKIISDALKQMKQLDNDYNKIIIELQKNGENKVIINALISNLQIRISFLQNVLQHIETNEKLISLKDEKTT